MSNETEMRVAYARWNEVKGQHLALNKKLQDAESRREALNRDLAQAQGKEEMVLRSVPVAAYDDTDPGSTRLKIARGEVSEINGRIVETEKNLAAVRADLRALDPEYRNARQVYAMAREQFCLGRAAVLEAQINGDQDLRKKLLEAFAAVGAVPDAETGSAVKPHWFGFLFDLFPPFSDTELRAAIEHFEAQHLKPLLGESP